MDIVSRELVGIIPATTLDATASGVAKGQSLRIPVTPTNSAEDIGASMSAMGENFQSIDNVEVKITKFRRCKITWQGEEQLGLGGLASPIMRDQYVQAMRTLVNEMEEDCGFEITQSAMMNGNIVGKGGTTPFASDLDDLTLALKKLQDNGSPTGDLQLALNTSAGMNLRNLSQLQKVNEGGDNSLLRRGILGNLFGFDVRESAGLKAHGTTSVTTGYVVNGAVTAGSTVKSVTVDTGAGAIKAGSMITFGSDSTNQYIVAEDVASGGTTIKLTTAVVANIADNANVNLVTNTPNVAFARGSVVLATRLPAVPAGGDSALDRTVITDPVSGISFEVALWGGQYENTMTISACWGCKDIKPEHAVAILG